MRDCLTYPNDQRIELAILKGVCLTSILLSLTFSIHILEWYRALLVHPCVCSTASFEFQISREQKKIEGTNGLKTEEKQEKSF